MVPVIQAATPQLAPVASALIYSTMRKMADYLFGSGDPQVAQGLLMRLFREKSNRFSYQFSEVATVSGEVSGLVLAYSGRMMKLLEWPTALHLLRAGGGLGFFRFVRRAFPLFGAKEVEREDYFISNVSVLPACQGQGLGKFLLSRAEQTARERGFKRISLTVDVENTGALWLYIRTGFNVIDTVKIKSLYRHIGYNGYHRMIKALA